MDSGRAKVGGRAEGMVAARRPEDAGTGASRSQGTGEPRRFHAPGRANLIGEHTDHTDGLVLPAAIDRGVSLEVFPGGHDIVLVSDAADGEVVVPADGAEPPARGWGRFVAAVAAELNLIGRPAVGMRGQVTSDLPQGAGLSSSAALEVAVGTALCAVAGFDLPPLELAACCRRAEHRAVGVPSGIMDQAASILGRADHAVFLDCATLEHRVVPLPPDHALLLVDSGVRRTLEGSGYRQRSEELASALGVLDGRRPATVDPDELPGLLARLDDVPARRLRHVVTENARVRATVSALEQGDLAALGPLFAAGHASLRDDYEVSVPELDVLVELATSAGATAARLTGGGFGGAIVALVRDEILDAVAAAVAAEYPKRFPQRIATVHRCRAAEGACQLRW
jgi:galactokinase